MMSHPLTRILLAALMITTAIVAYIAKPTRFMAEIHPRQPLSTEIPKEFARWKKLETNAVTVIDPTQIAVLKYLYTETLGASYVNAKNKLVMLSIAYGKDQSDGHDVHKPDLCYPAQGFSVLEKKELPLTLDAHRSVTLQYMKTQNGQRIEPLLFWTTVGDFVYRNKLQKKAIELKYSKANLIPDGMVLRVSTLEKDSTVALESLTDFIKDWYASMPEQQRSRYFGEKNL